MEQTDEILEDKLILQVLVMLRLNIEGERRKRMKR